MFKENDQPESSAQQIEQQALDSNEAARRMLMDYRPETLNCEHSGDLQAEAAAVDRSAQLMDQWGEGKDPLVREKLLDGVGREMMTVHEAPPAQLNSKEMPPNVRGAYTDRDFRVDFKRDELREDDPRKALTTYLHEYRHDEQQYEVQKSHGFGHETVDPERASSLEYNQHHYINEPYEDYRRQLVESDARAFAEKTANAILERRNHPRETNFEDAPVTSDGDRIAKRLLTERSDAK